MYRKNFVKEAISTLNTDRFERLKDILSNDHYVPFDFIEHNTVDKLILEEKISDYFEKVELLAGGKRFDYIIEQYAENLDSVVKDHISGTIRSVRGGTQLESRAKKYYDKAYTMRKDGLKSFEKLLDYTRIMLCLYMAVINKKYGTISDFDYSSECLNGSKIMESLRNEKTSYLLSERRKFDTRSAYSIDRCTFVIVVIMYQYIKSNEVEVDF